jgi:hypothetical protein
LREATSRISMGMAFPFLGRIFHLSYNPGQKSTEFSLWKTLSKS